MADQCRSKRGRGLRCLKPAGHEETWHHALRLSNWVEWQDPEPIPTPDCPAGDPYCGVCEDQIGT